MLRRRFRRKTASLLMQTSGSCSDIVKPDNTSLIVNESDTDELPKEITSVLDEDDDVIGDMNRASTSLMKSLSQKTQSTPVRVSSASIKVSTKKKNLRNNEEDKKNVCYFDQVLKACGAMPLAENSSYQLSLDQAVLAIKINNMLTQSDGNVTEFLNALKKKIEKPESFQKMLIHTLTAEDCDVARGPVQESLIRILLTVECLQVSLIEILLDKLADIILNCDDNKNAQIVSSVLRQLRFLNAAKEVKIAQKLFEILQIASINVQREIIFMLPEIVSEEETEEMSVKLIDMLKSENGLTNVVVDTVTNLNLTNAARCEVCSKIMNRLEKCPLEFLPSLVQFILSKCDEGEYFQIITGLRENLPFTPKHLAIRKSKKQPDEDSYVKLTFEILKFSAMASKQLAEVWLKLISSLTSSNDFRCLDLMVLIIFFSSLHGKKSQILSLIRTKIKTSILTETHVTNMFKILTVVASEYFSSLLELASSLIKSLQQTVADFGALMYKQCFIQFNYHKEQNVVNELLLHIGTGTPATVDTTLFTLKSLCDSHKESLSQHTISIMGILVKIVDLNHVQARLIVDIIASLIFFKSADHTSGWQDELQIFIRKQLSSSKPEISKKGIIAAIMLGKHAGMLEQDAEYVYTHINTLLGSAMGSPGTCDIKRAFFNDEFATVFHESSLNESFSQFWREKIHNVFVKNLFVRNIDIECEHFPMSLQYALDVGDDRRCVFPVVDLVINSNSSKTMNVPIPVIPSSLRLLWCCEKNSNKIQSVFGASIVMPELTVLDNFQTFDENRKKIVMDCLFLCANYIIESINAFCALGVLDKALIRLKHLMKVRQHISNHIHVIRDYTPPQCQFYAPVNKIVKNKNEKLPKKGKKRKADGSASTSAGLTPADSQAPALPSQIPGTHPETDLPVTKEESIDNLSAYEGYFRLLHVNCVRLLETDLASNVIGASQRSGIPMDENCWSTPSKSKMNMELHNDDALFLLEDCIRKTKEVLGKPKGNFGFKGTNSPSTVEETSPQVFVPVIISVLPSLMKKISFWSTYCNDLLNQNEGLLDGLGMYPKDSRDVKLALAASFKLVAGIIAWNGFQKPVNKSDLMNVLKILSKRGKPSNETSRVSLVSSIAQDAAASLVKYSKSILLVSGGLSLVKIVETCFGYCSSSGCCKLLGDLCLDMLRRPWFTVRGSPERGAIYNQHIDALLKIYFSVIENKLDVVKSMAKISLDEVGQLTNKDCTMNSMKSISRNTFPLLYRALCEALVSASTEKLTKKMNNESCLNTWNKIVETMVTLVEIVKVQSSRVNLAALLKRSQAIIQLFFTSGLPAIEVELRVNSVDVLKLLKSLQSVTRFLHSVCCHSKITSDSLVATYVPTTRAQCERLTLEVKGVLISNKIPMECITIAILRNKDLKGNDILSQESVKEDSDDDSELLPADDNDDMSDDVVNDLL